MVGQRFRIRTATIAVQHNSQLATIPADTVVLVTSTIEGDPLAHNARVTVEWNGQTATMFTVDVQERGERILVANT